MAVAASAPSLASLLTQETGSDGVLITGGVVVRVHSCFRSFLSPDFFLNTGLALKPDVDFTFDLEVCDGVEKVRGPSLSGARLRLFLTTRTSLHSTFRAHKIRAGDGDAAPGPKCRVRSRIDRERCARRARPCDSAQGCRIFPQTVRHPRFQFCAIGRIHFTAVFGDTLAPPLRTLLLPCPTLVRQRSPNPLLSVGGWASSFILSDFSSANPAMSSLAPLTPKKASTLSLGTVCLLRGDLFSRVAAVSFGPRVRCDDACILPLLPTVAPTPPMATDRLYARIRG